ncbi:hypothetical protein [Hydrogenophaga atypica]|uniref:Uncharacterized protein n=1 Tax=Hydrogenophaga atypica TaxID=249409 RepID=A0ABW2QLT2_9BURK
MIDHPDDGVDPRRLYVGLAEEVSEQELEQAMNHGKAIASRYLRRQFTAWTNAHQKHVERAAAGKDAAAKRAERFSFRGVVYSIDGPVVHPRSSPGL